MGLELRFDPGRDVTSREFYAGLPLADHLSERHHMLRLKVTAALVEWLHRFGGVESVADFGAGNGGLLGLLRESCPKLRTWGYDLLPANVQDARAKGLPVELRDFLAGPVEFAALNIFAETLEHLEQPETMLCRAPAGSRVLVTVPRFETSGPHYAGHLWAWDQSGLGELLGRCRYSVLRLESFDRVHLAVGVRDRAA